MAKKRKKPTIKKRITRALKKFVRANPRKQKVWEGTYNGQSYSSIATSKEAARRKIKSQYGVFVKGLVARGSDEWMRSKQNPTRVKGTKCNGGRAVSVRNFTGRVIRKRDGTVQILGRTRR